MFINIKYTILKKHNYINIKIFLSILILFFLTSCTMNTVKKGKNTLFKELEYYSVNYTNLDKLIVVKVSSQKLYLINKGKIVHTYSISTSSYGTGSKVNSFKTPLGRHVIAEKIGDDLPLGAILKGREWTGSIANIIKRPIDTDFDLVTSRILWLSGTEKGFNLGPGVDSKSRFIYIHGTAEEGLIGKPASDGCIRMYNDDVISLYSKVDINTKVWIL